MSHRSFQDEFGETPVEKKKTTMKAFMPIFGLMLFVALAAIAFVLSEPLTALLRDKMTDIPEGDEVRYVVGGMTFLVMLLFSGMLYAMFAPKPKLKITEAELKKERELKEREKKAMAKRKRMMNRQAGEDLKKRR